MKKSPYEKLLRKVYANGVEKSDRTGTGTRSLFGTQMRFNLSAGFPLVTTKFVPFRLVAEELLWFLRGESNISSLLAANVHIWDEWASNGGELGPVYGVQWRSWPAQNGGHIDQIARVIDEIKANPNSRRLVVSAWNVADLDAMALQPCHALFQFYVADGKLSCQLYQRSADMFLGVPFNIASYSLLTHMIAQQCDLDVGNFVWTGGDTHIYLNHLEQVEAQLRRDAYPFPTLTLLDRPSSIDGYTLDMMEVTNYRHHPTIRGAVSV